MNMASVTHSPRINKTLLNSSYGNGKYRRPRALLSVSVPVGTELRSEIQTSLWLSLTMASASNSVFGTGTWAKQFQKWSSNRTRWHQRSWEGKDIDLITHWYGQTLWIWNCSPCCKACELHPSDFCPKKIQMLYYCSSHIIIEYNRFSLTKGACVSEQTREHFLQGTNTATSRLLNAFWVKWAPTGKRP